MTAQPASARHTEDRHEGSAGLHALPPREVMARLLSAQLDSLGALQFELPALADAAARAAQALQAGGKLAYAGAGSSGLMAMADCLELAGTYGIAPARTPILFAGGTASLSHMIGAVEDDPELARADLATAALGPSDAVICVSASGRTPYTLVVAEGAQAAGASVIGIANVVGSPLLERADIAIALETGAELVSGSTRMAAGSAQKIALNMISTQIGLLLGHVHDGYMVNLTADNAKLRARATGMVAAIAGTPPEVAAHALDLAGGAVKPAVLIATGASPELAQDLLAASGGHLAAALDRLKLKLEAAKAQSI
ncbi:N-acetylmuramic acid 6-phosphate etherase [uncultured Thioclava sp.]|uniref:N-acetylmuramic acid 6-phosphate etherase n=1 Tax=uncultured Thioclava sp. TaxID=473858 RepID=UPI0025D18301|nr:N-acetylmuramic acid 6-phosphate etherase [uncultured Thioclava sp.]